MPDCVKMIGGMLGTGVSASAILGIFDRSSLVNTDLK